MGQKIHPISVRLNQNRSFDSCWFESAKQNYQNSLKKELLLRKAMESFFKNLAMSLPDLFLGRIFYQKSHKKTLVTFFIYKKPNDSYYRKSSKKKRKQNKKRFFRFSQKNQTKPIAKKLNPYNVASHSFLNAHQYTEPISLCAKAKREITATKTLVSTLPIAKKKKFIQFTQFFYKKIENSPYLGTFEFANIPDFQLKLPYLLKKKQNAFSEKRLKQVLKKKNNKKKRTQFFAKKNQKKNTHLHKQISKKKPLQNRKDTNFRVNVLKSQQKSVFHTPKKTNLMRKQKANSKKWISNNQKRGAWKNWVSNENQQSGSRNWASSKQSQKNWVYNQKKLMQSQANEKKQLRLNLALSRLAWLVFLRNTEKDVFQLVNKSPKNTDNTPKMSSFKSVRLKRISASNPYHALLGKFEEALSSFFEENIYLRPIVSRKITSSAIFLAQQIAQLIRKTQKKRMPYRDIKKLVLYSKIKGVRLQCSGRLGGVEMARKFFFKKGQTSLNVFSNKIDFATSVALTKYGIIGIKVWVSYE